MLKNNPRLLQYCNKYRANNIFLQYCNNKVPTINRSILKTIYYVYNIVKKGDEKNEKEYEGHTTPRDNVKKI